MTLQHIVLFSFPADLSAAEAAQMRDMVASWPGEIAFDYVLDEQTVFLPEHGPE